MPDEALITAIENILAQVVKLGGANERTSIVPNLIVQDANPTGLDGFVIVSDGRDGDNITARKLGSVIYANNDLVNVIFVEGAEAIAYQQGSGSANNGIWEIVPSTSTDIYYDKGNVGIGNAAPTTPLDVTGTVTISDDILHAVDTDTKISFTDDKISLDAGGLNMLALTETAQDLVEIGDVAGGGDVDVSLNNGGFFLRGSDTHLALGPDASPQAASTLNIQENQSGVTRLNIRNATAGATAQAQIRILNDLNQAFQVGITSSTFTTSGELTASDAFFQSLGGIDLVVRAVGAGNIKLGTNANVRMYISSSGLIGINGVISPSTELDIGAGAMEFDEMTAPGAGAVNTARLYAVDNGAGKTQLAVVFNTGAVQILATQP